MPLQIKELHIKLTVNGEQEEGPSASTTNAAAEAPNGNDKGLLVAECVEQVLEILKEKMEP